jgi:hypothetical protein
MGRYLLIELPDTDDAQVDDLVRGVRVGDDPTVWVEHNVSATGSLSGTVVAAFTRPRTLCTCAQRSDVSLLGRTFRWRICSECHKPKRLGAGQYLYNLLDGGGHRGGGWWARWKGSQYRRSIGWMSCTLSPTWVTHKDGTVTTLNAVNVAETVPELEEVGDGE